MITEWKITLGFLATGWTLIFGTFYFLTHSVWRAVSDAFIFTAFGVVMAAVAIAFLEFVFWLDERHD